MSKTHAPAVGLRCQTCAGPSIKVLSDPSKFTEMSRWACPHCSGWDGDDAKPLTNYNVMSFKVVPAHPAEVDAVDSIDEYDHDQDVMSERMRSDYEAVVIRGESRADRASDRGVSRDAIRMMIRRAEKKLQNLGEETAAVA